jgi:tetratricopeptide (TPR) repeat protein
MLFFCIALLCFNCSKEPSEETPPPNPNPGPVHKPAPPGEGGGVQPGALGPDPQLHTAQELLTRPDEESWNKAAGMFEAILEQDPENLTARVDLGAAFYKQGRYDKARPILEKAIKFSLERENGLERVRAYEFLGRIMSAEDQPEQAKAMLEKSVAALESFVAEHKGGQAYYGCPYQALGELYSNQGQQDKRAELYKRAADLESNSARSQFDAALAALASGEFEQALAYVERSLTISPSPEQAALKTLILERLGLAGDSVDDRFPDDPAAWGPEADRQAASHHKAFYDVATGLRLLRAKRYDEAEKRFASAAKVESATAGAEAGRGHLALIRKDFDKARERFDAAIKQMRKWPPSNEITTVLLAFDASVARSAWLGMGWLESNQARHVQAIGFYDKILANAPKDLLALVGKGNALTGLGRFDEAEPLFAKALKLQPGNPFALAELALVEYNRGDMASAEKHFQAALEASHGEYTCPFEGLGLVYLQRGQYDRARENFSKAIELNPNIEYKKYNGLAKILIKDGDLKKAEALLKKSIANYPYDTEASELLKKIESMRAGKPGSDQ